VPEVTAGSTSGYLAAGPPPGPWPGVVVIHESWGLNADIRAHADRLAAQGYLALAPDLYRGRSFVRCLRSVFQQLHAGTGPAFDLLNEDRAALAARPDCTGKIGVLGFCMGGARDQMGIEPPRRPEAALTTLHVPHDLKVYPGAGHSFMSTKPSWLTPLARLVRLDYKPEAAEDSWHRILAFFGAHLQS
jgi:carboxymethylenebutenolidase